jgi:hypothetical protein
MIEKKYGYFSQASGSFQGRSQELLLSKTK